MVRVRHGLNFDMTDYQLLSSASQSVIYHQTHILSASKICKVTDEILKAISGSMTATSGALSLRALEVNPMGHETHKPHKDKQQKAHKATQTEPIPRKQ